MTLDGLADKINGEISEIAFMTADGSTTDSAGVSGTYDWNIFDLIVESQKILYGTYDRLAGLDENARIAAKKLRQRIFMASQATKKAILKL